MPCTYATTGPTFVSQPIWECITCGIREGEALCEPCLHSCHAKCETRQVSESARAYCDCGSRGPSKCRGLVATTPTVAAAAMTPAAAAAVAARPRSAQAHTATSSQHQRQKSASPSAASAAAAGTSSVAKAVQGVLAGKFSSPPPFASAHIIPSQCTYVTTGPNFQAQPCYACFTCGLTGDLAVCAICIVRCHARHKIAFVSSTKKMYCDCGSRCPPPVKTLRSPAVSGASGAKSPTAASCHAHHPLSHREAHALSFLCTLTQTGPNFHLQKVFHCMDCNILADEICCENCALVCHRGHRIEERGSIRAYCDCSANGLCQTLDLASVVYARSSNTSSQSGTPGLFTLSRRSSFGPQLELTDLSQTNSAANSARPSRRGSLIKPQHGFESAPEEKVDAMSTAMRADMENEVMTMTHLEPQDVFAAEAEGDHATPDSHVASAVVAPTAIALDPAALSSPAAIEDHFGVLALADGNPAAPVAASFLSTSSTSPRLGALIDSLPRHPSLDAFLAAFEMSQYAATFQAHAITDVKLLLLRALDETGLDSLVPNKEHSLKIKSALLALRNRDNSSSPAIIAAAAASSGLPPMSLTTATRHSDQSCRIYLAVLSSMIKTGAIRPQDEELLSNLRHQSHLSFADHQSVLRKLDLDEHGLEVLKQKGTEQVEAAAEATAASGAPAAATVPECVVCMAEPSNQICIPCGHVCLCAKCAARFVEDATPATDATNVVVAASTSSAAADATRSRNSSSTESPRLRGLSCPKCRASVEHVYRCFL